MTRREIVEVAALIGSLPESTSRTDVAQAFVGYLSPNRPFFDGAAFMTVATAAE